LVKTVISMSPNISLCGGAAEVLVGSTNVAPSPSPYEREHKVNALGAILQL